MDCTRCNTPLDENGVCPKCAAEENVLKTEAVNEQSPAEQSPLEEMRTETPTPPLTAPVFFTSDADGAQAPRKKGIPRFLCAVIGAICMLQLLSLAYLTLGYFNEDYDHIGLFHKHRNTAAAEQVAQDCFDALFVDFSFEKYLNLLPEKAREAYLEDLMSAQGYSSAEELYEAMDAQQKKQYENFIFTDRKVFTTSVYTEEGVASFLENDYTSALFGNGYTSQDVQAIVTVTISFSFAEESGAEAQPATQEYLLAYMGDGWYEIG